VLTYRKHPLRSSSLATVVTIGNDTLGGPCPIIPTEPPCLVAYKLIQIVIDFVLFSQLGIFAFILHRNLNQKKIVQHTVKST
jgi:hypothetical protein